MHHRRHSSPGLLCRVPRVPSGLPGSSPGLLSVIMGGKKGGRDEGLLSVIIRLFPPSFLTSHRPPFRKCSNLPVIIVSFPHAPSARRCTLTPMLTPRLHPTIGHGASWHGWDADGSPPAHRRAVQAWQRCLRTDQALGPERPDRPQAHRPGAQSRCTDRTTPHRPQAHRPHRPATLCRRHVQAPCAGALCRCHVQATLATLHRAVLQQGRRRAAARDGAV